MILDASPADAAAVRYFAPVADRLSVVVADITRPDTWRGTLAQYVGRLHRAHDAKREVIVYDYVDGRVPVLARMAAKRQVGYRALGYSIRSEP